MPDKTNQISLITSDQVLSSEKFNQKLMTPFFERSVSEETRRAYRRVAKEFFTYFRYKHPSEITQGDVQK